MGGEGVRDASGSQSIQDTHRVLAVVSQPERVLAIASELRGRAEISIAADADAALAHLGRQEVDAVLLDLDLSGARTDLLPKLVRPSDKGEIPVLALSSDNAHAVLALESGAADFLAAPWQTGELAARLDRTVRQGKLQKALQKLAQTDVLTGLANYGALQGKLADELKRARRYRYPLSLVMVDLDYLKQVNDRFGHSVGNLALTDLAKHLRKNLRETDFAARFGGDEFVALLPYQAQSEAMIFAERVRMGLMSLGLEYPSGTPLPWRLSLSIGVADFLPGQKPDSAPDLLQAADLALYRAKEQGRNQTVGYRGLAEPSGLPSH